MLIIQTGRFSRRRRKELTPMTKIRVRKLKTADLMTVLDLFDKHIEVEHERKSAFKRRLLLSFFLSKPFDFLRIQTFIGSIAETNSNLLIGAIFARRFPFGKSWIIGPVVARRSFRGSGIALNLMDFAIDHLSRKNAKRAILSVETSNIQARRFFEKCGFRYLRSAFTNHELARKCVQQLTLSSGCLQNTSWDIEQSSLQNNVTHIDYEEEKNRTWLIMLREL